ncbi:hypothetical protein PHYPSEUDO_013682 [Phytophthora pseudosyringae]|uniref:Uncharacterized protein n=1 Tax=Phytophthora pseudosyringae TaxID=221518 RepID=A0A8T1W6I4_9STRA|nr:hypothetical protein PHYPSEUDO_013682 [Phytophthora pseudosyringae]
MSDSERDRKRQRVSEPETSLILDVDSPAKWDFLAPWCEELNGQLTVIHDNVIRVMGPLKKREKPFRFDVESDEEEEEKEDPQEVEKWLWKKREAIELLSLVAKVDRRAFHMLMTEQCGLESDDEGSEEEEEEELRFMLPGDDDGDVILSDDGESDEEEDVEEQDEDEDDGTEDEDDEDDDDVLVLPRDTANSEHHQERENFLLQRFDFISLTGIPGIPDSYESPTEEWQKLFLAEAPQYEPSEEYKKAKARILEMQQDDQPRIPRSLEIPVSLEFSNCSKSVDQLAGYLQQVGVLMEAMKDRAQKLTSVSEEVEKVSECASTIYYRVIELSMTLSQRGIFTNLLAERLCEVLGSEVPVGELHIYMKGGTGADEDQVANREALANLFTGMLLRPLSRAQKQLPAFGTLEIGCEDSALWEFEALCSAFSVSQTSIRNLSLPGACNYRKKDELRGRHWELVAQTFFHPNSCSGGSFSSVCALELSDVELTLDDLAEITAVLQEKEHQTLVAQRWDLCKKSWMLRENTPVQFMETEGDSTVVIASHSITLPYDACVELVQNDSDESTDDGLNDWLDVIIPAYGQCRVRRENVVAVATTEIESAHHKAGGPLTSLSLSFTSALTEAEGLEGLLKQIGWSLRELSLSFHREIDVNAMVPALLKACPNLTKLALDESFIDLDQFSTIYEGIESSEVEALPVLRALQFEDCYGIGEREGKEFMKRLGDPTSRLATHLRELTIHAEEYAEPLDRPTLSELWMALKTNVILEKLDIMMSRTMWSALWKRRLRSFNGQVLPSRRLALSSKLAFLRVTRPESSDGIKTLPVAQRLDRRVLSLIFEFAATRVVRLVQVYE